MRLIYGNMFNTYSYVLATGEKITIKPDALCIPTNGVVKLNGDAVMGRGCAKRAAITYPDLPVLLGRLLERLGNHVHMIIINPKTTFVTFPVKPVWALCAKDKSNVITYMQSKSHVGATVPGWACKADLALIEQSAKELKDLTTKQKWSYVVLPRPGCGNGELDWKDVKPILDTHLDDRFYCIDFIGNEAA